MSRIPLSRDDTAILVPALNESLRIREVVNDALTYCSQVIVIDDGSDDGTADCIADLPVTLIRHPQRMGKVPHCAAALPKPSGRACAR